MARRRPTKNIKEVRPTIIGAGITEQWYFTHLQSLFGLKIKIRPRYFGHETMNLMAKRIEQVLSDEGKAVVVFDTDACHPSSSGSFCIMSTLQGVSQLQSQSSPRW